MAKVVDRWWYKGYTAALYEEVNFIGIGAENIIWPAPKESRITIIGGVNHSNQNTTQSVNALINTFCNADLTTKENIVISGGATNTVAENVCGYDYVADLSDLNEPKFYWCENNNVVLIGNEHNMFDIYVMKMTAPNTQFCNSFVNNTCVGLSNVTINSSHMVSKNNETSNLVLTAGDVNGIGRNYVVDGRINSGDNYNGASFFKVDLSDYYKVDHIIDRVNSAEAGIVCRDYIISVSVDDINYEVVASGQETGYNTNRVHYFDARIVRYVKFQCNSTSLWGVSELEVYGEECS